MISKTLKALLDYVKADQNNLSLMGVVGAVAPIYNYKLDTSVAITRVVLKAFNEALDEPRFELGDKNVAIEKLIFSLVEDSFYANGDDTRVSLKYVYSTMVMYMLHQLYTARVDWLHDQETL